MQRTPRHAMASSAVARPLNARGIARTAVLLGGLVTLALFVVSGTYAYLSDSAAIPGGQVRAGSMNLQIDGGAHAALGEWETSPTETHVKGFQLELTGDVAGTVFATIDVPSTDALRDFTWMRMATVGPQATCPAELAGATHDIMTFDRTEVATLRPGAARRFCIEMGIDPATPAERSGESVAFNLTLTAEQVPGR